MRGLTRARALVSLLVLVIGCGSNESDPTPPDPETGSLAITVVTTGTSLDDSYTLSVGDSVETVSANQIKVFSDLPPGTITVALSDRANNCDNLLPETASVTITKGETAELSFEIECYTGGEISLTVVTTGLTPDPDGYLYRVDEGDQLPVGTNATVAIHTVRPGSRILHFGGIAAHCSPVVSDSLEVLVTAGATVNALLNVTCAVNQRGRIVFASTRGTPGGLNDVELWSIDPSGSYPLRLTNNAVVDNEPAVSPTGDGIAFTRGVFGQAADIWVADADGGNAHQVSTGGHATSPRWSPDGQSLVYSRRVGVTDVYDLVISPAAGGTAVTVGSTDSARTTRRRSPAWTSNGGRILYATDSSINSILVNGTDERVLRLMQVSHLRYSWAASKMVVNAPPAFDPNIPTWFGSGVWILNADGSTYRQIMTATPNTRFNSPSWSPNGDWLVVSRVVDGSGDANLWTYELGDDYESPLATEGDLNVSPAWD